MKPLLFSTLFLCSLTFLTDSHAVSKTSPPNTQVFNPVVPFKGGTQPTLNEPLFFRDPSFSASVREELSKLLRKTHFEEVGSQLRRFSIRLAQESFDKKHEFYKNKDYFDGVLPPNTLFFHCLLNAIYAIKAHIPKTMNVPRLDNICLDAILQASVEKMPPYLIERLCHMAPLGELFLSFEELDLLQSSLSPLLKDTSILKHERLKSFVLAIGRKMAFAYGDYSWEGALLYAINFSRVLPLLNLNSSVTP